MSVPSTQQVLEALARVQDPLMKIPLTALEMIKINEISTQRISLTVELTTMAFSKKDQIQQEIEEIIQAMEFQTIDLNIIEKTKQVVSPPKKASAQVQEQPPLPQVKHVLLVASGKGGVGKSTVAVNLAAALALTGADTGLLDADIYGPSVPIMLGLDGQGQPEVQKVDGQQQIIPMQAHGLETISMGFFVPPDVAMAWRGPMVHSALMQFIKEVQWNPLDYMVIDLPPGTGDVQMTLGQKLDVSGSVIVTTPQIVALADVIRAKAFFEKIRVPILGVVENMSYFTGDDGQKYDIFGHGGGAHAAERFALPLLGEIPLAPELRQQSDAGTPLV
ncbi:MAG: Mrp/NBP35 family ATP-binding protein, partial [Myxococcota bacterium]